MKSRAHNPRKPLILLLTVLLAEGLAAVVLFLTQPSMEKNAILLGYSLSRIILAGLFLLLLAVIFLALVHAIKDDNWLTLQIEKIDRLMILHGFLIPTTIILLILAFLGSAAIIASRMVVNFDVVLLLQKISQQAPGRFQLIQTVIKTAVSLVGWTVLAALQAVIYLLEVYSPSYKEAWKNGILLKALAVLFILGFTAWHWVILFFQLETFLKIPGWKWYFEIKSYQPSHWLFAAFLAVIIPGILLAWKVRRKVWLSLAILALMGSALQIGFGYMEGQGFESLRVIFSNSVFNNYAEAASRRPDFLQALVNYEELYGHDWYLGTKPPGVILVYNLVQRAAEFIQDQNGYAGRFYQLTSVISHFFPFLSMLVLIPLFRFSRSLFGQIEDALLPGILLVFCPTILLIPLFLDQVLYPAIFLAVLLVVQRANSTRSLPLAFLSGLAGYFALYFSFSLMVLLPLSALWMALYPLIEGKNADWRVTIKMLIGWGVGLLVGFLLLRLLLNYDILLRFGAAMEQHRRAKNFAPGIQQIMNAIFLNNAEFITWNGIPLVFSALLGLIYSSKRLLQKNPQNLDSLTLPFFITYVLLNFTGQTDGEVQRLWLFMVPVVCIYAASFAASLFKNKISGIMLIVCLELVTTFLLFKFQNFYG